jgi:ankyrin repeat protein
MRPNLGTHLWLSTPLLGLVTQKWCEVELSGSHRIFLTNVTVLRRSLNIDSLSLQLATIMAVDPYFLTQDNGAGAPVHFATTYGQLDMLHHLVNCGAEVNQRDPKGFTPLHRAAYLAHLDGYLEASRSLIKGAPNKS